MYVDHGQALLAIRILAAALILSSIYPVSKLMKSGSGQARSSVAIISIISLASPLVLLVAARIRAESSNDARVLQQMNVALSSLPALYLIATSAAAIALWIAWLVFKRHAA